MLNAETFWARTTPEPNTGCFLWMDCLVGGYGQLSIGRKLARAPRVAWTLEHGRIPAGMKVLHRCDNPPCVNPRHLFLGTLQDNAQDMARKGRSACRRLRPRTPVRTVASRLNP
jgi:hypothetical protein